MVPTGFCKRQVGSGMARRPCVTSTQSQWQLARTHWSISADTIVLARAMSPGGIQAALEQGENGCCAGFVGNDPLISGME